MSKIDLRLSERMQPETGMHEVMIRLNGERISTTITSDGREKKECVQAYAGSGVYVNSNYFGYYINHKKTQNPKVPLPDDKITCTKQLAEKNGWKIRSSGEIVIGNRRIETEESRYHENKSETIKKLCAYIIEECHATDKRDVTSDWLKVKIERFHYPERFFRKSPMKMSIYELIEEYLAEKIKKGMSFHTLRMIRGMNRMIARYENFVRATQKEKRNFSFNINTVTREDINQY